MDDRWPDDLLTGGILLVGVISISHCGFDLLFPNDIEHLFLCFWPFLYLWRNVCSSLLLIFKLGYLSFLLLSYKSFYIVWLLHPYQICDLQIFF